MRSLQYVILVGMLTVTSTGCTLERSWFQMNSNSPMPFFGLDFRLPRKTTNVEPVSHEQQLAQHWNSESNIKPVSNREASVESPSENLLSKLPKISTLTQNEKTETLTFTGPKAKFSP